MTATSADPTSGSVQGGDTVTLRCQSQADGERLRDPATATSISYCVSGMLVDTQSAIFFAYVSAIQPGVR